MSTEYDDSDFLEELVPSGPGIGVSPYRYEQVVNKANAIDSINETSTNSYPSVKAVVDYVTEHNGKTVFEGATNVSDGQKGVVPAPPQNNSSFPMFMTGDGSWTYLAVVPRIIARKVDGVWKSGVYLILDKVDSSKAVESYPLSAFVATPYMPGLMSAEDKLKLNMLNTINDNSPIPDKVIDDIINIS